MTTSYFGVPLPQTARGGYGVGKPPPTALGYAEDPLSYAQRFVALWKINPEPEESGKGLAGFEEALFGADTPSDRAHEQYLEALDEVLSHAHVTEPCREFIRKRYELCLITREPAETGEFGVPLDVFGLDIAQRRYGPFDSGARLKTVEGGLLDFHNATVLWMKDAGFYDPEMLQEEQELQEKWYDAFKAKYGK